ncbi:tryptophan-rich sensory protein TspO [Actibacterium lipolyticum]|uniref:TspO/MBR family protein n=1 Tax=Actibacterium lipolyticum TaxID=1524263 RepID=A0A238KVY0_9RHOB|nr:TspO/MBR family protein [Actibacterium lipolyticum]SMX46955.1 TspO/MBR family protein [Actibacterium lipolyticum]
MLALFLTFLAASAAAAATGVIFKPGAWYDALNKPSWTPRRWMFPVVWTILYIASAYAAARVAMESDSGQALAFWTLQIALNTLWTPVFFGAHRIKAGLVVIMCLWLAIALTLLAFVSVDLIAALLILPYLLWVTIATALNLWIWRNNVAQSA